MQQAKEIVSELLALGMTQDDISMKTGIPQPTISKIVTGRVSDVMSQTYLKLQALLKSQSKRRRKAEVA